MTAATEAALLEQAVEVLQERLPPGWTVTRTGGEGAGAGKGDALFSFDSESGMSNGVALVEARPGFAPGDVERLLGGLTRRLRDAVGPRPILLVSDFLSVRARELLAREDISYLDLAGNIRLIMRMPPIFIETSGADRRPQGNRGKRSVGFSGANFGRVVRFLAEVGPPYGVQAIARATGISRGWISRVLDRLADEGLIRRQPRGPVEQVDWPALLRLRGQSVDLFEVNMTRTYVAPHGARAALNAVAHADVSTRLVVSGSFAAVRVAPVAAPALLVLYLVPDGHPPFFDSVAERLGLLPADEGADVALLWPANPRPVEDPRPDSGLWLVNLPQLVVDCLGGTGRMPAEGEAVLEWMQANEQEWRFSSVDAYLVAKGPRR